jgi:hypothetical protein
MVVFVSFVLGIAMFYLGCLVYIGVRHPAIGKDTAAGSLEE